MIRAQNLSKSYGDYLALSDLSLEVAAGEVVGFLGPNGAGKTTTIRILSTYLTPSSGTAEIAGFNVQSQAHKARQMLGYLPETPPLYRELTVREYLSFVAELHGLKPKVVKQRVSEMIEKCFLQSVVHSPCAYLSKGFKQRVGIAQAIIHDPKVVILDEPTSGLDPMQINDIRALIRGLADDGKAVLMSTHILSEVYSTCARVVIVNGGRVVIQQDVERDAGEQSLEQLFLDAVSV